MVKFIRVKVLHPVTSAAVTDTQLKLHRHKYLPTVLSAANRVPRRHTGELYLVFTTSAVASPVERGQLV